MAREARLKIVAFWAVTLLLPLVLLEVGFRLATHPERRQPRLFVKDGEVAPWVAPERYRVRHSGWEGVAPNLVYEHRYASDPRGYFGPGRSVTYGTNALGLRGPMPSRGLGTHQIVFLGDSFTYGEGVRYEDLFVTRVAPLLRARALPGVRIETLNFGQPGLDTHDERLVLDHLGPSVAPGLVVLVLVPNDWPSDLVRGAHFIDVQGRFTSLYEAPPGWLRAWRTGGWILDRINGYRLDRAFQGLLQRIVAGLPHDHVAHTVAAEEIGEIHRAARRRGAGFVVVILPELLSLDAAYPYRYVHEAVREIGAGEGVQVLDLLPDFLGRDPAQLWVHESDHHPNEIAHRIIADRLGADLRAGFLREGQR